MSEPSTSSTGSAGSSRDDLLDRLAEEFVERYRRGERPPLKEYAERHPELAEEIRELFPALVHIEQVEEDLREPGGKPGGVASPSEPEPPPRRVGDFEIIREVGRGGMGVVYEAEQVSLGRRVALKILARFPSRDASSLERFRREARAAARLHHANVVPVFEVGQDGDLFYYAMQFIEGQGLDLVIGELRRIRDAARPGNAPAREADTIASRAYGRAGGRPGTAVDLRVSQAARSLLTGQFAPEGWVGAAGGAGDHPDAADDPADAPAPTMVTAFEKTEVIPAWPAVGQAEPARRPPAADPVSSGLASAAGLLSAGESSRRPYYLGVARIGRQAAEALAYAHERGIIHRDIKPSNLLLDGAGAIWITDFGLAKDDDEGLTHTGDVIGTFRYMAPERFRGEGDERVDVYALGLTLYELLALRPAFVSADRLRLLEKIKEEEPARPRSIDPRIPRDLETIVLKAIEKEPRRRYQSAAAMAEDLRRFVDDEPIEARPTGSLERLRLWCRRNPAMAYLLAVVATAVAVAFVGVAWGWRATEAARRHADERALLERVARQQAESTLRQFEAQQKLADDNFARALAVADAAISRVGEDPILQVPGLQSLRRELLESALGSYREFIRDRGDDRTMRSAVAAAHLRVGEIEALLGDEDESHEAIAQAIRHYGILDAESPGDRATAVGLARAYALRGEYRRAFRIAARLVEADPSHPRFGRLAAEIAEAGARHFEAAGSPPDALGFLEPALEFREARAREDPEDSAPLVALARTLNSLGNNLAAQGRFGEALAAFRRAATHAAGARARTARDLDSGRCLATALHRAGLMERRSGRPEEAARSFERAIDVWRPMAEENPAVPFLHSALSHEYASLAACWRSLGREGEAERSSERARDAIEHLPRRGAGDLFTLACARAGLAGLIDEPGSTPTAEDRSERHRQIGLAMEALREAVAAGYDEPAALRTHPDLAVLRDRADFRELAARLREPARPGGGRRPSTAGRAGGGG